jgi:hypothetical protein
MSKADPALEAIRQVRTQISRAYNNDPKLLAEHYMKGQEKLSDRMLRGDRDEKTSGLEELSAEPIERRP